MDMEFRVKELKYPNGTSNNPENGYESNVLWCSFQSR
jgi:hypothetical protein